MADLDRLLRIQDFNTKEVTGTTSSSTDTAASFGHGSKQVPAFWLTLEGDVYIPRFGVGANTIDVRSRRASEAFRVLLFF